MIRSETVSFSRRTLLHAVSSKLNLSSTDITWLARMHLTMHFQTACFKHAICCLTDHFCDARIHYSSGCQPVGCRSGVGGSKITTMKHKVTPKAPRIHIILPQVLFHQPALGSFILCYYWHYFDAQKVD